jgi:hypothetical protein
MGKVEIANGILEDIPPRCWTVLEEHQHLGMLWIRL